LEAEERTKNKTKKEKKLQAVTIVSAGIPPDENSAKT